MTTTVTQSEVLREVRDAILAGKDTIQDPVRIIQSIVDQHGNVRGQDTEFLVRCTFEHLRNCVRIVMRELHDADEEPDDQLVLPGYKRVQRVYLVNRNGKSLIVPVAKLTDSEILGKVEMLRKMRAGCRAHERDLLRYLKDRRP
jgi:hypothetical protein